MGSEAKYQLHPWKKPFTLLIVNQNSSSFRKFVKQVSQISAGDGGRGRKPPPKKKNVIKAHSGNICSHLRKFPDLCDTMRPHYGQLTMLSLEVLSWHLLKELEDFFLPEGWEVCEVMERVEHGVAVSTM